MRSSTSFLLLAGLCLISTLFVDNVVLADSYNPCPDNNCINTNSTRQDQVILGQFLLDSQITWDVVNQTGEALLYFDTPSNQTFTYYTLYPCFGAMDVLIGIRFVPTYASNNLSVLWEPTRTEIDWQADLLPNSRIYVKVICKQQFEKYGNVCARFDSVAYSQYQVLDIESEIAVAPNNTVIQATLLGGWTSAKIVWQKTGNSNDIYTVYRYDFTNEYDTNGKLDAPILITTSCGIQQLSDFDDITSVLTIEEDATTMSATVDSLDKSRATVINVIVSRRAGYGVAYTPVTLNDAGAFVPSMVILLAGVIALLLM